MTEKTIIKKLRLLQSVQPDFYTLHSIEKEIQNEIGFKKQFHLENLFSFSPVTSFIALAAVVLLFVGTFFIFFQDTVSRFIITTEISFAPDQYQKAKISLDFTKSQFINSPNNIASLSQSLALANTEMSGLRLKGETGKYTMQQCLALYTQYHAYLESLKNEVSSKNSSLNKQETTALLLEIKHYDQQTENKLHKYKS